MLIRSVLLQFQFVVFELFESKMIDDSLLENQDVDLQ